MCASHIINPPQETALGVTIVAPRELKVLTVKKTLPNGTVIVASFSVPESVGPPLAKGKVRAILLVGGGVNVPKDGGCQVTFLTQARAGSLARARSRVLCCRLLSSPLCRSCAPPFVCFAC